MNTTAATGEAEKFRVHILAIALAAKTGKEGDLREATELLLGAIAKSLDDFARRLGDPLKQTPACELDRDGEQIAVRPPRCPTCGSPDPKRHPAVQFEGEVQICSDQWHLN